MGEKGAGSEREGNKEWKIKGQDAGKEEWERRGREVVVSICKFFSFIYTRPLKLFVVLK